MSLTGLTPEQRRLVEEAGDRPVRIEDPELHQAYVLIRADVYERVRDVIEPRSSSTFTCRRASENRRRRSSATCPNC